MNAIEIARRMRELGETEEAQRAYLLALRDGDGATPEEEFEAAVYLFDSGYDYRVAYTSFQKLYNAGAHRPELLELMTGAFYEPNVKRLRERYERNRRRLEQYPYLFRKDFPDFEALPVKFYPFDDHGYLPFSPEADRFGGYVNVNHPVVSRNFFADLSRPVFASDVYSQYELEYLNDNVRKSEWCAKENHIYLHYSDWKTFCSWLCVLDLRDILKERKIVFLIEREKELYPIDFKEKFGIDYSAYEVKPFGVKEVKRLIWHTQLATHNGGDFFNEIFYGHPNLLANTSVMFDDLDKFTDIVRMNYQKAKQYPAQLNRIAEEGHMIPSVLRSMIHQKEITQKDLLVALFLGDEELSKHLDTESRVAPALFLQPHFHWIEYKLTGNERNDTVLSAEAYSKIQTSPYYQGFPYIKTFTPLRRPTTSYAATLRFMWAQVEEGKSRQQGREKEVKAPILPDELSNRLLNRSFMIDWQDRLYQDSRMVRFEDAKLNPRATFTALAAFLDLPYTQSMLECSGDAAVKVRNEQGELVLQGFDTSTVFNTYDEFANHEERVWLEFFLRDVYEKYGYDFQHYDGVPLTLESSKELIPKFTTINGYLKESWRRQVMQNPDRYRKQGMAGTDEEVAEAVAAGVLKNTDALRLNLAEILLRGLRFVNHNGQPLRLMTPLELDPALLEQPLYH